MIVEEFQLHNDELLALVKRGEYAIGTHTRFEISKKHMKEFVRFKYDMQDMDFRNLNFEFIKDYEFYLKTVKNISNNTAVKFEKLKPSPIMNLANLNNIATFAGCNLICTQIKIYKNKIHSFTMYLYICEMNGEFIHKWKSQVKKGTLTFIVLSLLKSKEYYGYELIEMVSRYTKIDIAEGTLYPLLNKLKTENLVQSRWVEQGSGLPRKYYIITSSGEEALREMASFWIQLGESINDIL